MTLSFPNQSRSLDAKRNLIRFWGYDSALEISFFIEVGALRKLNPPTESLEAGCLDAFDAVRERIHESARKAYARGHHGPYLLVAADF